MAPWLFTDAVLRGRPIRLNNGGRMKRDFTYVDDIVAGVVAALDRPPLDDSALKPGGAVAPHAIYNLGNDRSEELTRFLSIIEAATGKRALVEDAPLPPGDVLETHADIGHEREPARSSASRRISMRRRRYTRRADLATRSSPRAPSLLCRS